jgi:hypothetical protein
VGNAQTAGHLDGLRWFPVEPIANFLRRGGFLAGPDEKLAPRN